MIHKSLIAAMAAVIALAPASSAVAGPGESPFAGTYDWSYPEYGFPNVTISDKGQISGSAGEGREKTTISGRVGSDGSYSFTVTVTVFTDYPRPRGPSYETHRFAFQGTMALDAAGNIVGTSNGPFGSFAWTRQ